MRGLVAPGWSAVSRRCSNQLSYKSGDEAGIEPATTSLTVITSLSIGPRIAEDLGKAAERVGCCKGIHYKGNPAASGSTTEEILVPRL